MSEVPDTEKRGERLERRPAEALKSGVSPCESSSPSFSSRGTGSFASRCPRVPRRFTRESPGPDAYNLQRPLLSRHDFSRGASRTFRPRVTERTDAPTRPGPAPNQYRVSFRAVETRPSVPLFSRRGSVVWESGAGPSPCQYHVKDHLTRPRVPASCFTSRTARIPAQASGGTPGPGTYGPYQPPRRVARPRRRLLALAAAPVQPSRAPVPPGPGHYDPVDLGPVLSQPVSSAVFLSGTSRWTRDSPRPGSYQPSLLTKTSFIYRPGHSEGHFTRTESLKL